MISVHSTLNLSKQLSYQFLSIFMRLLGASGFLVGLLASVQNISQTFLQGIFGRLSDLYGRKKFLFIGFTFAGITFIVAAMSRSPLELLTMTFLNGVAFSILSPSWEGSIGDNTEKITRGKVIGKLNSIATYYAALMIFLIGVFSLSLDNDQEILGYRIIVAFSGLNFLVGAFLSLKVKTPKITEKLRRLSLFEPLKDRVFLKFLIFIHLWWFTMSIAWSYFPIYFSDILQLNIFQVGLVNTVFSLTMGVVANHFGPIIDKKGPKFALVVGFGTFWVFPLILALTHNFTLVVLANITAGFSLGVGIPAIQSYIIEVAGQERTGQYSGTYYFIWGLVTFVGSLTGGYIFDILTLQFGSSITLTYLFFGVAVLRLLTGILLVFIHNTRRLNKYEY